MKLYKVNGSLKTAEEIIKDDEWMKESGVRKSVWDFRKHIPAGKSIVSGTFLLTAPKESGLYTLNEFVSKSNSHCGWEWQKEE